MILVVGILAAVWFFWGYPLQDPRSTVSLTLTEENAELKAAEILSELGYSLSNYEQRMAFQSNRNLLDSLQHEMGRTNAVEFLEKDSVSLVKPYYWYVVFEQSSDVAAGTDEQTNQGEDPFESPGNQLIVKLDEQGKFIELGNESGVLPGNSADRKALTAVFQPDEDTASSEVFRSVPDSVLNRMLYFDLEQSYDDEPRMHSESEIQNRLEQGRPYRYTAREAEKMAAYYLDRTGWEPSDFEMDTVVVERVKSINSANVTFNNIDSGTHQQELSVDVQVTPTGTLLGLSHEYNNVSQNDDDFPIWPILRLGFSFLIGLTCIVAFFFRIRSRAIDTQSALVIAVIAGLVIPVIILLDEWGSVSFSGFDGAWAEHIFLMIRMGVSGALTSVGFFVLFALGDSLTRQHWPDKLSSYDYLRQGMLFNKPLGISMLRAAGLSFVLAGVWMIALLLFPDLYIGVEYIFLSEKVAWSPLYLLLNSLWISLLVVLTVFLALGSQVLAWTKSRAMVAVAVIVTTGIFVPLLITAGPSFQQFLVGCIFGTVLTIIYFKWDFLVLFASLFFFLLLQGSASGWMVPGSPDGLVFWMYVVLLIFVISSALIAVIKGKEERALPKYIPEYVEQLAQEERIKQELEIARGVQHSFLPSVMPEFKGLDIAAVCKPAYETGGDYYDVIKLSDQKIAVTIGDVSGKGVPAAFYMTFMKGIIHSLCRETDSPAQLLIKANRLFVENAKKGTFVSLVYGIIDLEKQVFTFARAGHNPILKINNRTGEFHELRPTGLGLGLTASTSFEENIKEVELPFTKDETLILYTDGIVEAQNNINDFYGSEKLRSSLMRHLKQSSANILRYSIKEVTEFIGSARQHDDMTMMVIRLKDEQPL